MCGRFDLSDKSTHLADFFTAADGFPDWRPRYSIAPTNRIPIIHELAHDSGEISRTVVPAVWDFTPGWQKPESKKRPQFNSRIETVAKLGLWKHAFAATRCIVPMSGYFEWQVAEEDGKPIKQPWFIHDELKPTMAAAGIYTSRLVDGAEQLSVSIITRAAHAAPGDVHDRMPVFLNEHVFDAWLDPAEIREPSHVEETLAMLDFVSEEEAAGLDIYRVDRRVNNSRTIDPFDPSIVVPI